MNETWYYWLTITSLLLTIIIYFRKNSISDIVSCAAVTVLYASGLFGKIYGNIYETTDCLTVLDALFLLITISIIYGTWIVPELCVKLFLEKFDFKGLVYSIGERLLMWIAIFICTILFKHLYDNSTPLICTVILTAIVAAKLSIGVSSKNMSDEDTDDHFCMVLVILIPCFFSLWLFNSLIGNYNIVNAFGAWTDYHYTTSVSLLPTIMLFLPIILGIASIDVNEIFMKREALSEKLENDTQQGSEKETIFEEIKVQDNQKCNGKRKKMNKREKHSRKLAYILRHDERSPLELGGWLPISYLTETEGLTKEEIEDIVASDSKGRFELNNYKTQVRALYGHSVKVEMDYKEVVPPENLLHGTSKYFLDSILKNGIDPHKRQYVHLTDDLSLATDTGDRHGKATILSVDAIKMHDQGIKFYNPVPHIWLVSSVPALYIEQLGATSEDIDKISVRQ